MIWLHIPKNCVEYLPSSNGTSTARLIQNCKLGNNIYLFQSFRGANKRESATATLTAGSKNADESTDSNLRQDIISLAPLYNRLHCYFPACNALLHEKTWQKITSQKADYSGVGPLRINKQLAFCTLCPEGNCTNGRHGYLEGRLGGGEQNSTPRGHPSLVNWYMSPVALPAASRSSKSFKDRVLQPPLAWGVGVVTFSSGPAPATDMGRFMG